MSFCIGGYKRRRRLSGIASYFYLVFALEKLEREGLLHLVLLHFISKRGYLFSFSSSLFGMQRIG